MSGRSKSRTCGCFLSGGQCWSISQSAYAATSLREGVVPSDDLGRVDVVEKDDHRNVEEREQFGLDQ